MMRLTGALSYLQRADPLYRWRLEAAECPLCGPSYFLALTRDPFLIRCLKCKANITNLAISEAARRSISDLGSRQAYEMSTYGSTYEFLKGHCGGFDCSEYLPGSKPGEIVNGVRNEDAQQLSFDDCSFDLITSNQVFEHVPDIASALRECRRTLKPAGVLLFTVPLYETRRTEQVATIEEGKIRWFSAPEYHYSRTSGPNSVPVFWRFSVSDICQIVSAAEFGSVTLVPITLCRAQEQPQFVVQAIR